MFADCNSMPSEPDTSSWVSLQENVEVGCMYERCKKISSFNNISKIRVKSIDSVFGLDGLFSECTSLVNAPDLSG